LKGVALVLLQQSPCHVPTSLQVTSCGSS
jgi:hypothetical protein